MAKITLNASTVDDLIHIVGDLIPPGTQAEWKLVWHETSVKYKDDKLVIEAKHHSGEEIGYITIFLSSSSYYEPNREMYKVAVFGDDQAVIRRTIQLWEQCNNEQYIVDFLAKKEVDDAGKK